MPIAQVGDSDTLQNWFNDIPIITKVLFVSTLLSGALTTFGIVDPYSQILVWPLILKKFQVWRLLTSCIFAGKFSFPFAMNLYLLYLNSRSLESRPFNTGSGGTSADYLFFVLFTVAVLLLVSFVFEMQVMSESFLFAIIYSWSRREPTAQTSIYGVRFKTLYLPWVYVGIHLIMGQSIVHPLIGIGVGHLFYFLAEILPISHGKQVLFTPNFCNTLVAYMTGLAATQNRTQPTPSAASFPSPGPNSAPDLRNRGRTGRSTYDWGQGRALGSQ